MPTYDANEWPLRVLKAKEAWALPLPNPPESKSHGEGVIIAHPDTGWTEHPELLKGNRYIRDNALSKNFFGRFAPHLPAEDILSGWSPSHGTTTASLMISEEGHPSMNPPNTNYPHYTVPVTDFVTGIAPKAEVIPLRVTDFVMLGSGHSSMHGQLVNTYRTLTQAIYYALTLNNDMVGVISISLGGARLPSYLEEALISARRRGVIVCCAAGQIVGGPGPAAPGRSVHALCVAGSAQDDSKPSEGFYGSAVDVTAPGWGVIVARTTGNVPRPTVPNPPRNFIIDPSSDGTSYATALTAGVCALWQAFHGRLNLIRTFGRPLLTDVFRYCLANSVRKPTGWDRYNRGMGILDVEALLRFALPSYSTAELVANSNYWPQSQWGDPADWGRI